MDTSSNEINKEYGDIGGNNYEDFHHRLPSINKGNRPIAASYQNIASNQVEHNALRDDLENEKELNNPTKEMFRNTDDFKTFEK